MTTAISSIKNFELTKNFTKAHPDKLNGNNTVTYRSKIKVHGTLCSIQINVDGTIECHNASGPLTPQNDSLGFATWANMYDAFWAADEEKMPYFLPRRMHQEDPYILYGEWCGPEVQNTAAISFISDKVFAVFAAINLNNPEQLVIDPNFLQEMTLGIPNVYVLPWHDESFEIDWSASNNHHNKIMNKAHEHLQTIEENDPWVERVFGVKGAGEGLVYYPISKEHLSVNDFNNLAFKTKGNKHKTEKVEKFTPIPRNILTNNANKFIKNILTEQFFVQNASKFFPTKQSEYTDTDIINFIEWSTNYIKEEFDKIPATDELSWGFVRRQSIRKAQDWIKIQSWFVPKKEQ